MPRILPDEERKTEIISFRVPKSVKKLWLDFIDEYVGYKREYGSISELLEDMIEDFKKPRVKVG